MILVIDNYDSFTYNLAQYLMQLGAAVKVVRNNEITMTEIVQQNPSHILISPGPGKPTESGISLDIIQHLVGKMPILGVCLGHEAIGHVYGGKISHAGQIMHGKNSLIFHNNAGVFTGLPSPFSATRYHSLVVNKNCVPDCLEVTAWTVDDEGNMDEIMGLKHKAYSLEGVQFHPEAILTEHGHALLQNFLRQ